MYTFVFKACMYRFYDSLNSFTCLSYAKYVKNTYIKSITINNLIKV